MKTLLHPFFDLLERKFKFSASLSQGDIGIKIGFDMDTTTTSDLFHMARMVGKGGTIIGIDPDPRNINKAKTLTDKCPGQIILQQYATFSSTGEMKMKVGKKASHNTFFNKKEDSLFDDEMMVKMDTMDNILENLNILPKEISHIHITNNGAEYDTLKGMTNLLSNAEDLSITLVAGRHGEEGLIDGKPDQKVIAQYLYDFGFRTKFKRKNNFFWMGFVKYHLIKGLLKGKWNFNKRTWGFVIAKKGSKDFGFLELL